MIRLLPGDCREILPTLADDSIEAIVTDPPYHLESIRQRFGKPTAKPAGNGYSGEFGRLQKGFMGKEWDNDIACDPEIWRQCLRVLKPGGHMAVFGSPRTHHRVWTAVEMAGFEIRETLGWVHGQGFPKNHDISKAIDKLASAEREEIGQMHFRQPRTGITNGATHGGESGGFNFKQTYPLTIPATPEAEQWQGWGTALKPALEMILLARKPLSEASVAKNVLRHCTGGINVDACRVPTNGEQIPYFETDGRQKFVQRGEQYVKTAGSSDAGRWPPNILLDGSDEVVAGFPQTRGGYSRRNPSNSGTDQRWGFVMDGRVVGYGDEGSAARFFPAFMYCPKANRKDRANSRHPTVKPIKLLEWLCRLITPPHGTILDLFAGSGTLGEAAMNCGFNSILIEQEPDYVADIERRLQMFLAASP